MAGTAEVRATVRTRTTVAQIKVAQIKKETRHPALVNQLLALHQQAKQLIDRPTTYRGAAFAKWKKEAADFFDCVHRFGVDFDGKARFQARQFGRSIDVLTDEQIFALFKRDMNQTIADLQSLFAAYRRHGELNSGRPVPFSDIDPFGMSIWKAVRRNPLMVGVVVVALTAIASAVLYLGK